MAGFVLNDFGLRMESPKSSEQKWYCVRSQPRQEHVAAAHLQRLIEIEVFCPRIRFRKCSRGGGALSVTQALFPGYLFAKFRFDLEHRMVRYAHGVRGLVHFGEKYPSLPDGLIASLRSGIGDTLSAFQPAILCGHILMDFNLDRLTNLNPWLPRV